MPTGVIVIPTDSNLAEQSIVVVIAIKVVNGWESIIGTARGFTMANHWLRAPLYLSLRRFTYEDLPRRLL